MAAPVYLIDDDNAVREGLTLLLQTVGIDVLSFATPNHFLTMLAKLDPGCVILDIRMPQISGLRLQEKLNVLGVDWPIIIISGHGDVEACRKAFKNGAFDFLSKPVDEQDLIDAIQKSHAELEVKRGHILEVDEARHLFSQLTKREKEVLELIAKGLTTRQIAMALELSPRTIDSHRAAIGAKAGTTSAAELTRLWLDIQKGP